MIKHSSLATLSLLLVVLSVNACREAPRFTLHDGTDPETGTRSTIRIDTSSGKAEILKSITPAAGYSLTYWKQVHDEATAVAVVKAYQGATNTGTSTIK